LLKLGVQVLEFLATGGTVTSLVCTQAHLKINGVLDRTTRPMLPYFVELGTTVGRTEVAYGLFLSFHAGLPIQHCELMGGLVGWLGVATFFFNSEGAEER
jgi:hypothetical protein